MPYIVLKQLKNKDYAYIYHTVRSGGLHIKVYLGYLGSVEALTDPNSSIYDSNAAVLIENKSQHRTMTGEDKQRLRRVLEAFGVDYSPRDVKDRAEQIAARRRRNRAFA